MLLPAVAISCSGDDTVLVPLLLAVVQLAADKEEEAAVNAVPDDRGVMTEHLDGVKTMGCGDVVVDQFR